LGYLSGADYDIYKLKKSSYYMIRVRDYSSVSSKYAGQIYWLNNLSLLPLRRVGMCRGFFVNEYNADELDRNSKRIIGRIWDTSHPAIQKELIFYLK
jgi:hypothetical protein